MFKTIARLGKLLAENFLLVVPLILACFPIAAYLEYGPGRDFILAAAITTPLILVISWVMIRHHRIYGAAGRDHGPLLARLKKEGTQVSARVADVQQGNAFFNELPVMLITLEYRYGERIYTRTIPRAVAYDSLHLIQPGDTRQVWIDVHNPRTVVF